MRPALEVHYPSRPLFEGGAIIAPISLMGKQTGILRNLQGSLAWDFLLGLAHGRPRQEAGQEEGV